MVKDYGKISEKQAERLAALGEIRDRERAEQKARFRSSGRLVHIKKMEERKISALTVMITPPERGALEQGAEELGLTISSYVRMLLKKAMRSG